MTLSERSSPVWQAYCTGALVRCVSIRGSADIKGGPY